MTMLLVVLIMLPVSIELVVEVAGWWLDRKNLRRKP